MKFGSVCSGIEAASVAWHPLGWKSAFYSEIEKFPRAVLQHHYPDVPLHGDFTTIKNGDYDAIDLLVGGTPCQAFSIAGLRKGFSDERGNLTLEFVRLAQRLRPRWLVWENVPGVLSIDGGGAFGSFLGGLGECGYGFAYRVLDAQYFGVPQRRRRVFVVGYLGDWRPAAQVLFERESLCGDITPSREAREEIAGTLGARSGRSLGAQDADCGHLRPMPADVASTLNAHFGDKMGLEDQHINEGAPLFVPSPISFDCKASGQNGFGIGEVASTMRSMSHANSHQNGGGHLAVAFAQNQMGEVREGDVFNTLNTNSNASGRNTPLVAIPINTQMALRGAETSNSSREGIGTGNEGDPAFTLQSAHSHAVAVGWSEELTAHENLAGTIQRGGSGGRHDGVMTPDMQVRRLTPIECERLQGFPDNYTKITDKAADGPRYKALGNSMAVPVMRWIGERIDLVDKQRRAA